MYSAGHALQTCSQALELECSIKEDALPTELKVMEGASLDMTDVIQKAVLHS
jgi:hypothetical protein